MVKYVKIDPASGEMVLLVKASPQARMPRRHQSGTVIACTIKGRWQYLEHDWVAEPGSVVYSGPGECKTAQALGGDEDILVLKVVVGDLAFLDDRGEVLAIENCETGLHRYKEHCRSAGIPARDLANLS
ncbi:MULTISPECIES: 2,4'-dihydroxyacetophenone dioxygenase family protein [Ramlibacter]|uniref:Cupin n=1 Tax=Ramlibacter pinisoli TaxID=2682844 RepID=A0A6N8IWE9_9BURK|nr:MULTISPECIES: 2,4'-dihydroxyacetophenone dioxygenase family protein [Ramlibacter]MBA2960929.1 2,4'-dihydroxyacetophenone dioxygenase family protein [Ramlibacter sp. CGMCC 1.13660]MVQ30875.1 cupin [Ramlibacter pinisoli]